MEGKEGLMICPNCGYIRDNAALKFCEKCGTEMRLYEEKLLKEDDSPKEENVTNTADSLVKETNDRANEGHETLEEISSKSIITKKKKSRITKIIIAACVFAIIIIGVLVAVLSSDKVSFDKASAESFSVNDLVCYVPQGWEEYSSDNEESAYYSYYNDNGERIATIGAFHLSDSYSVKFWLPMVAEQFDLDEDEFSDISLTGCSEAIVNYGEDDGEYSNWYIVKCDQSIFVILHKSKARFYDKSVFEEILQATEFEMYETPETIPEIETYQGCDVPDYGVFSGAALTDTGTGGYAGTSGKYVIHYDAWYSYNISSGQKDSLEDYFVLLENAGYEMGKHEDGDYWIFKSDYDYELVVVDYTEGVLKIYLGE